MVQKPKRHLRSLNSSLDVLQYLGESSEPVSLTTISADLKLSKSTVHAILSNLEYRNYATRSSETALYSLGVNAWRLGYQASRQVRLKRFIRPYLEKLTQVTKEASLCAVPLVNSLNILYLDAVRSPSPIRAYVEEGEVAPCHCVASGKAIIAYDKDLLKRLEASDSLKKYTANTINDKNKLLKELDNIRRIGTSINRGEYREDIIGIAAPLFIADKRIIGAIGCSGPMFRISKSKEIFIRNQVFAIASEISAKYRTYRQLT